MFMSMRPMAGAMPMRTGRGMHSTIFSRRLTVDSRMNTMPSTRMMTIAAWKDAT